MTIPPTPAPDEDDDRHPRAILSGMTPADLARYALQQWMLAADLLADTKAEHEHRQALAYEPGAALGLRESLGGLVADMAHHTTTMRSWHLLAQTAVDVSNLDSELPAPTDLAGYDLAVARRWFLEMCARGEGNEPVPPMSAAARWRVMSPDQRAAAKAVIGAMFIEHAVRES